MVLNFYSHKKIALHKFDMLVQLVSFGLKINTEIEKKNSSNSDFRIYRIYRTYSDLRIFSFDWMN
jgi:hypothetical protein